MGGEIGRRSREKGGTQNIFCGKKKVAKERKNQTNNNKNVGS